MRKHLLYLLVLSSYFLLHSCASPQHKNDTVVYTDDYNRTVQVPVAPQRVVSTSPAVTEIIYALGGQELLVGRTDFCTYPPEAASVESIGGISNLNVEKIVSLNPDIVISGSMIPKKSTDQLEKMGVATVHVIEKQRFDGLYENISRIGQLIGRAPQADSLNEVLRERIHTLTHSHIHALTHSSIPSIYYVVGFGPTGNFTAG
ncbi:MAG: ABC transporter substrate-binding protein, partial [Bacteroidales bacterium]|nr:ABC transporter substrate-binding protein [Bacteroidales bacterium]